MKRKRTHHMLATRLVLGILLAGIATDALAQPLVPFGPAIREQDFQLFAPVEIDLDNEPAQTSWGYYLSWDKLSWSFSGERYTVGDPDVEVLSERIYVIQPDDDPNPLFPNGIPEPYQIHNGLTDVVPDAGFAWGDRYTIGYRNFGQGWFIGILDGPELSQSQIHGLSEPGILPGDPFPDQDGDALPPIDPDYEGPAPGPFFALGFGSVHVNFQTPDGYLFGFRDYLNYLAGATIGTQVGPIAYVGNYGGTTETDPDDDDGTIEFVRLTDDIDEDGIPGAIIVVDPVTGLLTTMTDFGDLHEFNIAFDQVIVRNRTHTNGIEAMWTHELTNQHYMAKHQNNRLEVAFGARYLELYDQFGFTADGGILGRTYSETSINNQIVGPQVAAKWTNQRARWRISANARFLFGYNVQDWSQINGIGEELVPGATNRLLYAQPTYSAHGLQREEFSPVGELRIDVAYYLTRAVALKAGYTGMYVGHIRRAAPSVQYFLPDMGYREAGTQDFLVNGYNLGIEIVY